MVMLINLTTNSYLIPDPLKFTNTKGHSGYPTIGLTLISEKTFWCNNIKNLYEGDKAFHHGYPWFGEYVFEHWDLKEIEKQVQAP